MVCEYITYHICGVSNKVVEKKGEISTSFDPLKGCSNSIVCNAKMWKLTQCPSVEQL